MSDAAFARRLPSQLVGGWEMGLLILLALIYLGGAVVNPAFFGSTNLVAPILMTAALAEQHGQRDQHGRAFDFAFTGDARISPAPIDQALRQMPPIWPSP